MSLVVDPTRKELQALKRVMNWRGKRVLEIGCGDGRLTLRLASLGPERIEAMDPQARLIRQARRQKPKRYAQRIRYHVGQAEHLKYPPAVFDVVVFAWVL